MARAAGHFRRWRDNGRRVSGADPVGSAARLIVQALLWWLLAGIAMLLGAATLWVLAAPIRQPDPAPLAQVRLLSPGERARLFATADPFRPGLAQPEQAGTAMVTALALRLFATRTSVDGTVEGTVDGKVDGKGSAIIAAADGVQQLYRPGDEVAPGVQLAAVAFDHVELSRSGLRELLYLDQSADRAVSPQADGTQAP
ncbi:type II secretion system protein N [Novosphingobium sp.]|uniref:type II secretion system protein N n=1 Tax=Novosphingobium sp. TaxID=1874826 RepID=UPI0038B8BF2D